MHQVVSKIDTKSQEEMLDEIGQLREKVIWSPCFAYEHDKMRGLIWGEQLTHVSHLFSSLPLRSLEMKEHTHPTNQMVQLHNFVQSLQGLVKQGSTQWELSKFMASVNNHALLLQINIGFLEPVCRSEHEFIVDGYDYCQDSDVRMKILLGKEPHAIIPLILDAYRQNREESVEIVCDIGKPLDCFLLISPIAEQIKLALPEVQSYSKEQMTETAG
jgi:hypothetical protein